MDLYFSPMACSLASRIACYEADADVRFIEVDPATKQTSDGQNYLDVYPVGLVPALRLDDGSLLTENAAVLQHIAALYPEAALAPTGAVPLARLQQWLCFIGTELHKAMFIPLFDKRGPDGAGAYALKKARPRLDYLDAHLQGREFLLDSFSVADAYLCAVLNWTAPTKVDLSPWPGIAAYHRRMMQRPSVSRAIAEEYALYETEVARKRAI